MNEIIGCGNFLGTLERHKLKESKFWGNITAQGELFTILLSLVMF